jgi:hypothetical protein
LEAPEHVRRYADNLADYLRERLHDLGYATCKDLLANAAQDGISQEQLEELSALTEQLVSIAKTGKIPFEK